MRSRFLSTDSEGWIRKAGGPCHGFALLPGKPADAARTLLLGSYPVEVHVRGESEPLVIPGPGAFYRAKALEDFAIKGSPSESWCLVTFEAPEEGARMGGGRTRATGQLVARGTAIPTAAPTDASTEGFRLRPGDRVWQAYVEGAAVNVDIYTQALDGAWLLAEDDAVASTDTRPVILVRSVSAAIGRLYFRASAGSGTYGVDLEQEAG